MYHVITHQFPGHPEWAWDGRVLYKSMKAAKRDADTLQSRYPDSGTFHARRPWCGRKRASVRCDCLHCIMVRTVRDAGEGKGAGNDG